MDVEKVLEVLTAHQLIKTHRITGNYMTCTCPFHKGGQERKPSFGILLHEEMRGGQKYPEGFCHCFTCGYAGTLADTITKILESRSISQSGQEWLVAHVPGFVAPSDIDALVSKDVLNQLTNTFALDYVATHSGVTSVPPVSEEELAKYRFTVPYMYERKMTDEMIAKFDVGFDPDWIPPGRKNKVPCITFPVRDASGTTLFLCRRSIQGKMYNYPEGVVKPVYGIDQVPPGCASLLICESCINAITAWSYGYPAVALLGTGNPYQMQQLRETGIREFVLGFDGDEGGDRATKRFKRELQSNAIIWTMHLPAGKDINDCSRAEFEELYKNKD